MGKHKWVDEVEEQLRAEQRAILKSLRSKADEPATVEDVVQMARLDEIEDLLD